LIKKIALLLVILSILLLGCAGKSSPFSDEEAKESGSITGIVDSVQFFERGWAGPDCIFLGIGGTSWTFTYDGSQDILVKLLNLKMGTRVEITYSRLESIWQSNVLPMKDITKVEEIGLD
jgi:hypothetical protein